jgi:hypothetical protein
MCCPKRRHVRRKGLQQPEQDLIDHLCDVGIDTDSALIVKDYCLFESYRLYKEPPRGIDDGANVCLQVIVIMGVVGLIFALVFASVTILVICLLGICIPGSILLYDHYDKYRYERDTALVHWRIADLSYTKYDPDLSYYYTQRYRESKKYSLPTLETYVNVA